jgi:hypothetical protein
MTPARPLNAVLLGGIAAVGKQPGVRQCRRLFRKPEFRLRKPRTQIEKPPCRLRYNVFE